MRIVLVDDHTLFRMGVRHVLTNTPGYEVVGEASTARSAFRIIDSLTPDVVLMDIAMPGWTACSRPARSDGARRRRAC